MYIEKEQIEIVHISKDIIVVGLNLQNSGLPITFDSLGKMWERYTIEIKNNTPNPTENQIEYGLCLNKVPDYVVGIEATRIPKESKDYYGYTIASGDYIKASFNAQNHDVLVSERLMNMEKKAKKWAKDNKVKCNTNYTVEVYPKNKVEQEFPEMYVLIPVAK